MKLKPFFLLLLSIMGFFSCTGNGTSSNENKTLEYKLAVIDAGRYVRDDDITVARFRTLLELLSEKFIEDRQQIADMTVKAQSILRDKGVSESLLSIMEGINGVFYGDRGHQKYAEYVGAYVTLRIQGQTHDEAIRGLRAMLRSMGVK